MKAMTDIHQHLLYGIDDGPKDAAGMHALLLSADDQGINRIAATPHACPGFKPFDPVLYEERLEEARQFCREKKLNIEIMAGAEIAWTYHTVDSLRRKALPTLNGTDYVLLELWPDVRWAEVSTAVSRLCSAGFIPVLAHVERYRCFVWNPGKAAELKQTHDIMYQINASSVLSRGGPIMNRFIRRMIGERIVDVVASDAHNCSTRPQRLLEAFKAIEAQYGKDYALELTSFHEVTG